uniref:Methyltransferase FkbM domain-containing protein n=1 Tax=Pyramimonas obovata TaxID=1411642 RepID=A0A7S0RJF6_9CHLO|mmetsp:Transcript_35993/g.78532  ORF Transcript_35993/g.78532 Transcript_35993/m.78532 type:complete len:354 (+) Transcript_35993:71-1132(+)|eukprot:CAMPEP_0118941848 /NCGR_PEP_ID=MMETSP1169-20130426/34798_1 /TAXON_ID=36882 /ORGANISM="Pyramimonas obovata, Strain CCMP722" /LENGTH=353 /DNA_ID=CAMNT_0006886713 /DNA_START=18 /DNA_END=1079 /DNA_ORIENTATION=-
MPVRQRAALWIVLAFVGCSGGQGWSLGTGGVKAQNDGGQCCMVGCRVCEANTASSNGPALETAQAGVGYDHSVAAEDDAADLEGSSGGRASRAMQQRTGFTAPHRKVNNKMRRQERMVGIIMSTWKTKPRYPYDIDMLPHRLEQLSIKMRFTPKFILDVGANEGSWTREVRNIFPRTEFFMIEAVPKHEKTLRDVGAPYAFAVLGDEEKDVQFFQAKTSTGNSLFRETSQAFRNVAPTKTRMRTLDNVLAEHNHTGPVDLLKIDTQGAEILVLKGAKRTLSKTTLIVLELSIQQFNEGAPRAATVIAFLAECGFEPYDITEMHYLPNGQLMQYDFMFARRDSPLLNTPVSKFF